MHCQRRRGLFDSVNVQDLAGDAVEIVGVACNDLDEKVSRTGKTMNCKNFRYLLQRAGDRIQFALRPRGRDEGSQRIPKTIWVHPSLKGVQGAVIFQPVEPSMHGIARQPRGLGQRDNRCAGVTVKRGKDQRINSIYDVSGGDQIANRLGNYSWCR